MTVPKVMLPGTWRKIDLTTEASTRRTIRQVVEKSVGRADDKATLRAQFRSKFQLAADAARKGGAVEYHIAFELVPGFPLSATMALFLVEGDLGRLDGEGPDAVGKVLSRFVPAGKEGSRDTTFEAGEIKAVRRTSRKLRPATDDEPEAEILQADYWIAAAEPSRMAMMSFTTTYLFVEDDMLDLFDAIVMTTRWKAPENVESAEPAEAVAS